MKNTLADVKSILNITEGSSWNLKTEHEKSFHLIHKEVEEGRLEIGADTKYLQSHVTYMQLEHQNRRGWEYTKK